MTERPPTVSDPDDAPPAPAGGPSRLLLHAAILGLFALVSLAVLLASWPGYVTATHTRAAERALDEQRWADALPHLEAITARFPSAWLRQRQLGDALLELDRGAEAIEAYRLALRFEPSLDLAAPLGRALYLADPTDPEGPRLLREALVRRPADPQAHFYVALYLMDQGRYREAAPHLLGATAEPRWFERSRPHLRALRDRLLGA